MAQGSYVPSQGNDSVIDTMLAKLHCKYNTYVVYVHTRVRTVRTGILTVSMDRVKPYHCTHCSTPTRGSSKVETGTCMKRRTDTFRLTWREDGRMPQHDFANVRQGCVVLASDASPVTGPSACAT